MILTYSQGSVQDTVTLPGFGYSQDNQDEQWINSLVAENGEVITYDHQVKQYWIGGKVEIDETDLADLKGFLDTVGFMKLSFSLEPDSGVDFGAGAGTTVEVRYWDTKLKYRMKAFNWYEVSLKFRREETS